MSDRADITAATLTGVGYVAAFIMAISTKYSGLPVFLVATIPIFAYALYWALSIRHALAVPLYRRQALGIAFIVVAYWLTLGVFWVVPSTWPLAAYTVITNYSFYSLFIILFYWIDASILASRRSDPLLRDTLYWSKIRKSIWIVVAITWFIPLAVISYAGIAGDVSLMNDFNSGTFPNTELYLLLRIVYNLPILVLICGIIYLPAIAIRARWDQSLRRHFIWFAPTALGLLILFFGIVGSLGSLGLYIGALIIVITGYTLYRSAKALVPLNRLSQSEVAPSPVNSTTT